MTMNPLHRRDGSILNENLVQAFKSGFPGRIISPADTEYDAVCRLWNAGVSKRPGLIAHCTSAADVVHAVKFARQYDVQLAIRGGGHGVAGWALCEGGLVLDMSGMKDVVIEPGSHVVHAQAGALVGDVSTVASAHGLAVPMGANSKVGIAGLTLGGGVGWLTRKYGLACDNLLSCEVVTADGTLLTVDAQTHADLFWGLRGGAGNFGIVTSLRFQARPVNEVVGGFMMFAREEAIPVLRQYRAFMTSAPDELTVYAALMSSPEGVPGIALMLCHCGTHTEAVRSIDALRAFGTPLMERVGPMPFDAMQRIADAGAPNGFHNYLRSTVMPALTDDAIELLVEQANRSPSPYCMTLVQRLGGAMARVRNDATAFPHRDAMYNVGIEARWMDPEDRGVFVTWASDFFEALRPYSGNTSLVNFLGDEDAESVRRAFGANHARLATLKTKYDPANVFNLNPNIQPR